MKLGMNIVTLKATSVLQFSVSYN